MNREKLMQNIKIETFIKEIMLKDFQQLKTTKIQDKMNDVCLSLSPRTYTCSGLGEQVTMFTN